MKRVLFAAVVAAAVLTFDGCGLDSWPYLYPPNTVEATPLSPYFKIIDVATSVAEFRGFELYYKFFDNDQSAEQTLQQNLSTREQLLSYQFKRMCSPGTSLDGPKPLIDVDAVDRNTVFTIELDFSVVVTSEPSADYQGITPRTIDIRRSAFSDVSQTETFEKSELDLADEDMGTVTFPVSGEDLHLVVYALSYGVQDYTGLYSDAQYLGSMTYHF